MYPGTSKDREVCLRRVRNHLSGADNERDVYRGDVFIAAVFMADARG
jgi:hypothetical protein